MADVGDGVDLDGAAAAEAAARLKAIQALPEDDREGTSFEIPTRHD
jgi:hypothetical protein